MPLMLLVTVIFTLTSLNDKYAVSKCRYNGSELTFIMAAFTALFLTPLLFLPFYRQDIYPVSRIGDMRASHSTC